MWHVSFHNCWSDVESFYRLNESIILYSSKIIMANIQLCTNIYEVFHNVRQKKANSKSISKISCSLLCERMTSCHGQRLSFSSVILPLLPIKCLRIATPKKGEWPTAHSYYSQISTYSWHTGRLWLIKTCLIYETRHHQALLISHWLNNKALTLSTHTHTHTSVQN